MSKLMELVQEEAERQIQSRGLREPDDFRQDSIVRVLGEEEIPAEVEGWIKATIRKQAQTHLKRRQRRAATRPLLSDLTTPCNIENADSDFDSVAFDDALGHVANDEFELATLRVLSGQHPEYSTFHEFAQAEQHCSRSHAYRRKPEIEARVIAELCETSG